MLHFDEENHIYTVDGEVYPGVTSVIKPLLSFGGTSEAILEYAANRGRAVHKACEIRNAGQQFAKPLDPVIVPYLDAWDKFLREKRVTITAAEQHLAHGTMRYAGTFDALGEIENDEWLLDIKAVAKLHPATGVQLAGYEGLLGRKVRRAAVQLKPDGTYLFQEYRNKSDWPVFVSCLTIYNYRINNHVE